ncbi:MAG: nucleotide exchange factor GrpE [Acidobacteria bacterium]|nr:MAG: nucleotide exchange factor GrpE [Acidobacteriota bacterium]
MFDQDEIELQIDEDPEEIVIEVIEDDVQEVSPDEPRTEAEADEPGLSDDDGPADFEKLHAEIDHLREMYLRKLAEFDNFRKRIEREREEREKLAGLEVVQDLIPVIDNFERALGHASESSLEALEQGVGMIAKQLIDVLERRGLEVFNPAGELFDPESHEAIQRVEDSDLPPGTVAWVLAKGFRYGGRLLRPAMVGVVAGSTEKASSSESEEGSMP